MATNAEILYLDNNPYYTYSFSLERVAYNFTFRFSVREQCWYMDVRTIDNIPIILSVKLVPNYPMLEGLTLTAFTGNFYLLPIVDDNIYKFETDPENISEYFDLVYIYET